MTPQRQAMVTTIYRHFVFSSQKQKINLKKILQLGWESLLISFVFLALMVFKAWAITVRLDEFEPPDFCL